MQNGPSETDGGENGRGIAERLLSKVTQGSPSAELDESSVGGQPLLFVERRFAECEQGREIAIDLVFVAGTLLFENFGSLLLFLCRGPDGCLLEVVVPLQKGMDPIFLFIHVGVRLF